MTEIEREFHKDCFSKKNVARSARSKRTHTGKGGRVRLPHDNLTKKELEKMNGECKAYRLNKPMAWEEFKQMPDDLKIAYIKALRETYNAPTKEIAKMLGVSYFLYGETLRRLGISEPTGTRRTATEEWFKWLDGNKGEEPVEEKEPVAEDDTCDLEPDWESLCTELHDRNLALLIEVDKLREENADLLGKVVNHAEFVTRDYHNRVVEVLEAKLEIVEMIFGKR